MDPLKPRETTTPVSTLNSTTSTKTTKSITSRRTLGNAILVNPAQQKNPILRCIHNVPYEFDDSIKPDYVVGATTGVLYLSLRYHRLYPSYIFERMAALARMYVLKVLLVLVDTEDHHTALRELNVAAIAQGFTLMLSWSHEETARYLETYKAFESKPDDLIREKQQQQPSSDDDKYYQDMTETLTQIRTVNKTDVLTLLSTFGSFHAIANASAQQLALCPGFGERKVNHVQQAFTQPFVIHDNRDKHSS
ncbi:excision repair cross-complementing 1 ercc1 [Halteromyces radiatus]|uniref:excision repair cross-complementing 1 ercc1 n=1 Tax=Halteromyces radiatus TaxID=101107 RepID=UPI00222129BA|nr:excision repair cross-complementing 1 ercc1 [Halteromyces radiatus]KAI8076857.1 excision repair cross-complementing 1 ercc1 [Halteromyces radiatus]